VDKTLPHGGKWSQYGKYKRFISNGALFGVAEIDSPYAREKILSGEWNHVSPSIDATVYETQDGRIVVQDGKFDHVLYVDDPAFTKADTREINNIGAALQAAYSQSQNHVIVGTHPEGKATDLKQLIKNQGDKMTDDKLKEQTPIKIEKIDYGKLAKEIVQAQKDAEKPDYDAVVKENESLKNRLEANDKIAKEYHSKEIADVTQMHKDAGLEVNEEKGKELGAMSIKELQTVKTLVQAMTKKPGTKTEGKPDMKYKKFQSRKDEDGVTVNLGRYDHETKQWVDE